MLPILPLALPLMLLALSRTAAAYPDGAPPAHSGAAGEPDCSVCHAGGMEGEPTVDLVNFPNTVNAGEKIRFVLRMAHPAMSNAGLQLKLRSRDHGQAQLTNLHFTTGEFARVEHKGMYFWNHRQPIPANKGNVEISGEWRAPDEPGDVIMDLAIVLGDDDLSPFGDAVVTFSHQAKVK